MSAAPSCDRSPLASAAEWAPRRGWRVIPLHHPVPGGGCSCRAGRACPSVGKHPRFAGWEAEATADAGTIRRWAERFPAANVGVATGRGSGLLVLDVDPGHGGAETLAELERQHGPLPATVGVLTGGGGVHHYFRHPVGGAATRASVAPGLDVRGDGGLVVAPGSLHASGRRYEWDAAHHPDDVALAPPPPWLLELVSRARSVGDGTSARPAGEWAELLAEVREGARNATLAAVAGHLARRGVAQPVAEAAVLGVNLARCRPPLPEAEVLAIVASIGAREEERRRLAPIARPEADVWGRAHAGVLP